MYNIKKSPTPDQGWGLACFKLLNYNFLAVNNVYSLL